VAGGVERGRVWPGVGGRQKTLGFPIRSLLCVVESVKGWSWKRDEEKRVVARACKTTSSGGFPQLWLRSHSIHPDRLEHFGGGGEHVVAKSRTDQNSVISSSKKSQTPNTTSKVELRISPYGELVVGRLGLLSLDCPRLARFQAEGEHPATCKV